MITEINGEVENIELCFNSEDDDNRTIIKSNNNSHLVLDEKQAVELANQIMNHYYGI